MFSPAVFCISAPDTSCDGQGQARTNGTYMCDVTLFQQRRAATASESLDVPVARVVWPSGSELHATVGFDRLGDVLSRVPSSVLIGV